MCDWWGVRLTVGLVLLLGVLAAPGSGLTHGAAHSREASHRAEHESDLGAHHHDGDDHATPEAGPVAGVTPSTPLVGAPDDHRGHDHARVDDGLRSRADAPLLLRAERVAVPVVREQRTRTVAVVPHAALPRADPATGPPPRLRAPPTA